MPLKPPILFINFKTYAEATGKNAVKFAKLAEFAAKKTHKSVALVAQAADISTLSNSTNLPIFAQHVDPIKFGANTGFILPEAIKSAGAIGTVINHAENKRSNDFVKDAVFRCHELGLKVMACAETSERAAQLAAFSPDFIAVEPPELIGGNISVSTAQPEIITESVSSIKSINPKIKVICGAGIKTGVDVQKAIELGSEGIFVASGIVKAKNPKQAILDMLSGFL